MLQVGNKFVIVESDETDSPGPNKYLVPLYDKPKKPSAIVIPRREQHSGKNYTTFEFKNYLLFKTFK